MRLYHGSNLKLTSVSVIPLRGFIIKVPDTSMIVSTTSLQQEW